MGDVLVLEIEDLVVQVFTGIYSEETGCAQPLRISIRAELTPPARFAPDSALSDSLNYMDLKRAAIDGLSGGEHFQLIEAAAERVMAILFDRDPRIRSITVKIVKLAISEAGEAIGMTLARRRSTP